MSKKIKTYIVSLIIPLALGGFSAYLTRDSMDIYKEINTPPLSPPSILFPIVWTILFALMGISCAMIYLKKDMDGKGVKDALTIYAISLIVNLIWTLIFFNMRAFIAAVVCIVLLLILITATIVKYSRLDKTAAYLQIPYLVWVAFATYLNIAIAILN